MRYFTFAAVMFLWLFLLPGCKKDEGQVAPSNLVVATDISNDGSGLVTFTATAGNAVTYNFEFGNGEVITGTSGNATCKYIIGGTNTYDVTVTAISISGLSVKKTIQVTVTVAGEQGLFWYDEFNTDGAPDPAKWGYDIGTGSNGWGNSELEYYTNRPENVIVKNGILNITAINESYKGSGYTSARMLTMNKFAFTYGKVIVRAKLPSAKGTWPAIWMLGSNISDVGWPACGELDIMEHRGNELNKIFGTIHYPGHSGGNGIGNTVMIQNAATDFHMYKVEWSSSSIKLFVDDQLFHTVTNSTDIPFNHNFFLIINLAMGGTFGGPVDPSFTTDTLKVDYIRVYK